MTGVVMPSRVSAPRRADADSEWIGFAVSVVGHLGLLLIAVVGLLQFTKEAAPPPDPVEVEIVSDEVGLVSTIPKPAPLPPAPRIAPEQGPPEEAAPPEMAPPVPAPRVPQTPPTPSPKPAPAARPTPAVRPAPPAARPAPARPAPATTNGRTPRRPGIDRSLVAGLRDTPGAPTRAPSPATTTAASAPIGAAQVAALGRVIREQLKPHWRAPTGADAEQLRTELRVTLSRTGAVTSMAVLRTTGITDSNKTQVRLHQEAAMKAVRLASPFNGLPPELYDSWSVLEMLGFDRRLSQ